MNKDHALKQIARLWNGLPTRHRVAVAVSSALVVVGMAVLLSWAGRPRLQTLYSGLAPEDMAEVVEALEQAGTPYELGGSGKSILVPADAVPRIRLDLAAEGLPGGGGTVGFEIFDRSNFGISSFAQRTNFIRAIQGELARTIMQMRSVKSARVLIVAPENRLVQDGVPTVPTASVFVQTAGQLDQAAVRSIRFLVANAVEGLAIENVAVADQNGSLLSDSGESKEWTETAGGMLTYKSSLETYYTQKIQSLLGQVVGPENVVARVSVDLEMRQEKRVEELYDPDSQVVRSQSVRENVSRTAESKGERGTGADSNLLEEPVQAPVARANSSVTEEKDRSVDYEINRTTIEAVSKPGTITSIGAAVFLATQAELNAEGVEEPTPRSSEELERIAAMVQNALGKQSVVTVEEMPFSRVSGDEQVPVFELPRDPVFWIEQLRFVVMVLAAVIMFLIFLRMLRRQRQQIASVEVIGAEESAEAKRSMRNVTPGMLTPDLLNALIDEKPENVSTALKNWVANANKAKHD